MSTDAILQQFHATLAECKPLREDHVKFLCAQAIEILNTQPNLASVPSPATIVGDIHGQFWDLMELFKVGGEVPDVNYVFMGDMVDRGYHSVETFCLLILLKVRYPNRITLIRGNHESRNITQVYGFYDECLRKYGSVNVWRYCTEVFDQLPLAALVDQKVFCVHAGLSPSVQTFEQLNEIERRIEIPLSGPMADLLWSDPEEGIDGWAMSQRGCGFHFGHDAAHAFNATNKIDLICRSHQLVMEGYKAIFDDSLVTVWSAPNYCYRCGNVASILELDEHNNKNFKIFEEAPEDAHAMAVGAKKDSTPEYFL